MPSTRAACEPVVGFGCANGRARPRSTAARGAASASMARASATRGTRAPTAARSSAARPLGARRVRRRHLRVRARSGVACDAATCAAGCGVGFCAHGVCIWPARRLGPDVRDADVPTTTRTPCSGNGDCDEAMLCSARRSGGDRRLLGAPPPCDCSRGLKDDGVCNCFGGKRAEVHAARVPGGCSGRGAATTACARAGGGRRTARGRRAPAAARATLLLRRRVRLPHGYTGVDRAVAHACPDAGGQTRGVCEPPPIPPPPPPRTVGHALFLRPSPSPPRRRRRRAPTASSSARARAAAASRLFRRRLLAEGVRKKCEPNGYHHGDGRVRVRGGVDGADVQPGSEKVLGRGNR